LIGASKPEQVIDAVNCIDKTDFSAEELAAINHILR